MLPKTDILIDNEANSTIIGKEESKQCNKLSDLGRAAGKVVSDKDEDHVPVYQDVQQKN